MPLSKTVLSKEKAESVAIDYQPMSIGSSVSPQALEYIKKTKTRGHFRVDKIISEYVGIDELEKQSREKEIAESSIKLAQEIQEKAYEEAYNLGLQEGKDCAYEDEKSRINSELEHIRALIEEIKKIKIDLLKENEKQIVRLCFYIAKRLLMKEVENNENYIQSVIEKTLDIAQTKEELIIRLAAEDKLWIDQNKETIFKELNLDKNTKIEEDSKISRGGVIIETNHGIIDATIEQRLEKLEEIIKTKT